MRNNNIYTETNNNRTFIKNLTIGIAATLLLLVSLGLIKNSAQAASCAVTADLGTATQTVNIPTSNTYYIWSRVMASSSSANSYSLEINGNTCLTVGGSIVTPVSTWVWVKNQTTLTANSNTVFKMIGTQAGVKLDKIIVTSDAACTPTGITGDCAVVADTTPPTITLTSPTDGETISGIKTLTATATDASGINKVEFYHGFNLIATDTTAPYSYDFDTKTVANGSAVIGAKSYDNAGNSSLENSKATVTINNPIGQPDLVVTSISQTPANPTAGQQVVFSAVVKNQGAVATSLGVNHGARFKVNGQVVSWTQNNTNISIAVGASITLTANNGPTGSPNWPAVAGTHQITADVDDQNVIVESNESNNSLTKSLTIVEPADTQPPSVPTGLTATATNSTTVSLSWSPSTDNVGVTGYWIVRNGVTIAQLGSVTTYSDNNVQPSTTYNYQVAARDAAGNTSPYSPIVGVTTPPAPDTTPPTVPANLSAIAVSQSQINLAWTASTDNVGVVGYDIYQSTTSSAPVKIASVNTTSYGNTNLSSGVAYTYYVIAKDAAGLQSQPSTSVTATTLDPPPTLYGSISGVVSDDSGPAEGATVRIYINGNRYTYSTNASGVYSITDLPEDIYNLWFNIKKFKPETRDVTVNSGFNTVQNITFIK